MDAATSSALNLFISYAHEDEKLCRQLLKHLSQLQRDGIQGWYDRRITGGTEWAGEIDEHLNTADIILLLISSDFLASKYCYDVEMKRALERHDQKDDRARVVPIILRPCEWKNSPFSRLNVLPTDGKPVVDWPTPDHGFLNTVEGLRLVVEDLRGKADTPPATAVSVKPEFRVFSEARPFRWVGAAAGTILVFVAGLFWWSKQQGYIAQGEGSLDIGRYVTARLPFQEALRWNPWRARAKHGLETAMLYDLLPKPVEFEQRLDELSKEAPSDPHLKILEGDFSLSQGRVDDALASYHKAADPDSHVAEAHFRMCLLYDMQRNLGRALTACQKAVELSPISPQYRANLASQYFKHGEYQQAIDEYRKVVDGYPLANVELAKILRLQGALDEAREKGQLAIEALENDSVMANLPENSLPWILEVGPKEIVYMASKGQKLCYARLDLSATIHLLGDESQAAGNATQAATACGSQRRDVKSIVDRELMRLADENTELASRVDAYRTRVLAAWAK